MIVLEDGSLAVLQEGQPLERLISNISCGLPYEERRPFDPAPGENYENSPGTGSPESSRHSGGKLGLRRLAFMGELLESINGGIEVADRWIQQRPDQVKK